MDLGWEFRRKIGAMTDKWVVLLALLEGGSISHILRSMCGNGILVKWLSKWKAISCNWFSLVCQQSSIRFNHSKKNKINKIYPFIGKNSKKSPENQHSTG